MSDDVAAVFSALFNREISPDSDFSMDTEQEWDSMKHIEIIMTLEEELGVSFDAADIPRLTSLKKIIQKVKEIKG